MVFGIDLFGKDNPCIICPHGVTIPEGDGYAPYSTSGDNRTCAELIQEALTVESGTDDCGWKGSYELVCCKTEPENPCIICPNGIANAAGDDHVPGTWTKSCKYLSDWAIKFDAESDACGVYGSVIPECCPLSTVSSTTSPTTENPCIICPSGVTAPEGNDWIPFSNDNRTCAELVQDALTVQYGTDECGWYEIDDTYHCCRTEPAIRCNICPNGITADDDHIPVSFSQTCKEISDMSQLYESGSDACGVLDDAVPECCPPSTVRTTTNSLALLLRLLRSSGLLLIPPLLRRPLLPLLLHCKSHHEATYCESMLPLISTACASCEMFFA
jgi:hypothetical protein